ncbi:MAG: hypothetical protein LBH75_03120 [Treponema sp.]|jgi:hypothetical protein|nr:hypothetical protein [Treponema sp.]
MENKILRKLTDEEKQKITFVINDLLSEDLPEEPTEYDVLMKQKIEEFTSDLLKDDEPSQIDTLLEMCREYLEENEKGSFSGFGLIVMYDMWLNKSSIWPVLYNPEWEEWSKLKEKKVKMENKVLIKK